MDNLNALLITNYQNNTDSIANTGNTANTGRCF